MRAGEVAAAVHTCRCLLCWGVCVSAFPDQLCKVFPLMQTTFVYFSYMNINLHVIHLNLSFHQVGILPKVFIWPRNMESNSWHIASKKNFIDFALNGAHAGVCFRGATLKSVYTWRSTHNNNLRSAPRDGGGCSCCLPSSHVVHTHSGGNTGGGGLWCWSLIAVDITVVSVLHWIQTSASSTLLA